MTLAAEVVTPLLPESASIDGETRDAVAEQLGDLGAIRTDYGGLDLTLEQGLRLEARLAARARAEAARG